MGHTVAKVLCAIVFALSLSPAAQAQSLSPASDHPPPGSATATLEQVQRWFQLDAPFSKRLKVTFDIRPAPTYEMLSLPMYEGRAVLFEHGNFNVTLFERVAPGLALDCRLTCASTLEYSLGAEARLKLGAVNHRIPETHLSVLGGALRGGRGFSVRSLIGIGGLLDL